MEPLRGVEILRAAIFHTPGNPFVETDALTAFDDGGLAIAEGRIVACGDFHEVAAFHPDASVRDLRGRHIIPGLIDTHVHFPRVRVLGGIGCSLQDWLDQRALPEEARLSGAGYVFGSRFASAMELAALFALAEAESVREVRVAGEVLFRRKTDETH